MGDPLDCFGLTSGECLRAARERGLAGAAALGHYQGLFRVGLMPGEGSGLRPGVLPVVDWATEPTPEGPTTKLVSRVAGGLRGSPEAGLTIESVLIPMLGRSGRRTSTLCVSSQVGCAMGCGFCETAQMGLVRSLGASEIVAQWFNARWGWPAGLRAERPEGPGPIDNIVFMGMGEPMDNLDEVVRAIRVLTDHHGPAVPMSKITISTVGRIDGLRALGELMREPGWKRLGLAISISAPNDEIRSRIMPINRAMPLVALRDALLGMGLAPHRKLCFEYVLIPGVNDADAHADELAEYLRPFGHGSTGPRGLVNVIPYNPRRDSPWPAPEEHEVERFVARLAERGMFVKRRRTKGRAQMAACGQLGAAHIRARRLVPITASGSTA